MRDPYTVLGVPRGATDDEIKKAYRKIAKDNHPDRNAGNAAKLERFKEASAANTLLSDPDQRARFDRGEIDADGNPKSPAGYGGFGGNGGGGGPWGARPSASSSTFEFGGGDASDLFSELFGRGRSPFGAGGGGASDFADQMRRQSMPKGADVAYRLSVPFEEAATLKPQRITLRNGKTIDLKLPAGFSSDKPLRMAGQGENGQGGHGDALITLDVAPHRFFKRDGDDIRLDLAVTLNEAVDGARVRVPTVDGPVTLTIAPGSTSGRTLRLKSRGFTRPNGSRGDLLVTLVVDLPAEDAELQAFTARWHDARKVRAALGVD